MLAGLEVLKEFGKWFGPSPASLEAFFVSERSVGDLLYFGIWEALCVQEDRKPLVWH